MARTPRKPKAAPNPTRIDFAGGYYMTIEPGVFTLYKKGKNQDAATGYYGKLEHLFIGLMQRQVAAVQPSSLDALAQAYRDACGEICGVCEAFIAAGHAPKFVLPAER